MDKMSISARLCLFVLIGSISILCFMGCLSYWSLARSYQQETQHFLKGEVVLIREALVQNHSQHIIGELSLPDIGLSHRHMIRVLDGYGNLVYQTANMKPIFKTPSQLKQPLRENDVVNLRFNGSTYAIYCTNIYLNDNKQYQIQVAYNISEQMAVLNAFLRQAIITTVCAILALLIITYFSVKLGLSPIRKLANEIASVDINRLDQRFDEAMVDSEFRLLVQSFNRLMAKVEMGYARLQQFSSNIAHELKTPLHSLMLGHEALHGSANLKENQQAIIESNLEELQALSTIIDKLLFIAKAEAKSVYMQITYVDLKQLIEDILELYLPLCEEQGIDVQFKGQGNINADISLLKTAVSNLMSNAIRYGGKKNNISIKQMAQQVCIDVEDFGPGVDEQHIEKLTQTFYRAHEHRAKQTGGAGLGLSIVDSIMQVHDGNLILLHNAPSGLKARLIFNNVTT